MPKHGDVVSSRLPPMPTFTMGSPRAAVTPGQLFDDIYPELPERLRRQREELLGEGSKE